MAGRPLLILTIKMKIDIYITGGLFDVFGVLCSLVRAARRATAAWMNNRTQNTEQTEQT